MKIEKDYLKEVIEMYNDALKIKSYPERVLRLAFCLTLLEDKKLLQELNSEQKT